MAFNILSRVGTFLRLIKRPRTWILLNACVGVDVSLDVECVVTLVTTLFERNGTTGEIEAFFLFKHNLLVVGYN